MVSWVELRPSWDFRQVRVRASWRAYFLDQETGSASVLVLLKEVAVLLSKQVLEVLLELRHLMEEVS